MPPRLDQPTILGPYRYIGGAQSNGRVRLLWHRRTRVHFDVAGKPGTSLLAGVENQIGQLSYFVLYRVEPAATGPTSAR